MHVNNLVILLHPSAVSLFGHQLNVVARQFKRTSEIRQELLRKPPRSCWPAAAGIATNTKLPQVARAA